MASCRPLIPVDGPGGGGFPDYGVPLVGISNGAFFAAATGNKFALTGNFSGESDRGGNRLTVVGGTNYDYGFTADDITTAVQDGSKGRTLQNIGGSFYNDGNNFALVNQSNDTLSTATCATPYKMSTTGAFVGQKDLKTAGPAGMSDIFAVTVSDGGSHVYVSDASQNLFHYETATPYDFTALVYQSRIDNSSGIPYDITITPDGKYLLASIPNATFQVLRFELATPFALSSAGAGVQINLSAAIAGQALSLIRGIQIDIWRQTAYASFDSTNRIYQIDWTG